MSASSGVLPDGYYERTQRNHLWLGGVEGQNLLHQLTIGVAGLGGMGGNIAVLLARLGVGHLKLADPDIIEMSNINRQVVADGETLGMKKITALHNLVQKIAPDIQFTLFEEGITPENAAAFVQGCDVVVDEIDVSCLDRHLLLHDEANRLQLPVYSAYAIGYGVHVYKFQGTKFTFHNFLGELPPDLQAPSAEYLLERICHPLPSYFRGPLLSQIVAEMKAGRVPILGPVTHLGHSLVATRLLVDCLQQRRPDWVLDVYGGIPTPLMPQFLRIDLIECSFQVLLYPARGKETHAV